MYELSRMRDIRALEFFIFGGVPEVAEPMHGRDFHAQAHVVFTRSLPETSLLHQPQTCGIKTGRLEFDVKTGAMTIIDYDPPQGA